MFAWHFLADTGLLRDGTEPPPDGKWLEYAGKREMCCAGLHAAIKPLDALIYSPGPIICRVEIDTEGIIQQHDKINVARRKILWRYDASAALRHFARLCALDVIKFWDAPDIVVRYLRTGDLSSQPAVWAAAWDAALDAAGARANAGARAAARAGTAARARDAAGTAARPWDAAWAAARDGAAANAGAWRKQNTRLCRMLMEQRKGD